MPTITRKEDTIIQGQARFFHHLYGGLSTVALRCALELNIAGIINSHAGPVTLSQIAHAINSPSLNIDGLSRLMRFLVHKQIFDVLHQPEHEQPHYTLNECSKFLLKDSASTLAPWAMFFTDPFQFSQFYNLNHSIEEGCTAAFKTFGVEIGDLFSGNPEASKSFNEAMACTARMDIEVIMSSYDFGSLKGTLVDVGGGIGVTINGIVTKYPHLKGINYDLPHVVASAPAYEGVTHVGGDMFAAIPPGDSYFIKSVLHDWSDGKCVQILKNCRQSISNNSGKVIISDIVLNLGGDDDFDDARISVDMIMLAACNGGKERTEGEWKKILEEAGFCRYNVIKVPTIVSIIEAYME